MVRILDTTLVIAAIAGAVWTYQIKIAAEESSRDLSTLQSDIASIENEIVLLEAGWSIVTGPERLERVAETFQSDLQLKPMESTQIITDAELPPMRVVEPESDTLQASDGDIDFMPTGSISTPLTVPKRRPR